MPLLPFLHDTKENIEVLVRKAKDSGASYILPYFGVTLRKGSRDYFYMALDKEFPTIKAQYQRSFSEQYECYIHHYRNL